MGFVVEKHRVCEFSRTSSALSILFNPQIISPSSYSLSQSCFKVLNLNLQLSVAHFLLFYFEEKDYVFFERHSREKYQIQFQQARQRRNLFTEGEADGWVF